MTDDIKAILETAYTENRDFATYVDKMCTSRNIPLDTALGLKLVHHVYTYYTGHTLYTSENDKSSAN